MLQARFNSGLYERIRLATAEDFPGVFIKRTGGGFDVDGDALEAIQNIYRFIISSMTTTTVNAGAPKVQAVSPRAPKISELSKEAFTGLHEAGADIAELFHLPEGLLKIAMGSFKRFLGPSKTICEYADIPMRACLVFERIEQIADELSPKPVTHSMHTLRQQLDSAVVPPPSPR